MRIVSNKMRRTVHHRNKRTKWRITSKNKTTKKSIKRMLRTK
jgi:ferredoxin-thioredoxin reductase catalytic subunit